MKSADNDRPMDRQNLAIINGGGSAQIQNDIGMLIVDVNFSSDDKYN